MPNRYTLPTAEIRQRFETRRNFLHRICDRIDAENAFSFDDWQILFFVLESYQPDFIFELGRGEGNSTTVFLDYRMRYPLTTFVSIDLYDTWHQEVTKRLPQGLPAAFFGGELIHSDFLDFDCKRVCSMSWRRMLIFWDVNDTEVAQKLISEVLENLFDRDVLVCMHDVSCYSGRPRRYYWRQYESLYEDLIIAGKFIDSKEWAAAMPVPEQIFGHYRNAGHWLMFQPRPEIAGTDGNR